MPPAPAASASRAPDLGKRVLQFLSDAHRAHKKNALAAGGSWSGAVAAAASAGVSRATSAVADVVELATMPRRLLLEVRVDAVSMTRASAPARGGSSAGTVRVSRASLQMTLTYGKGDTVAVAAETTPLAGDGTQHREGATYTASWGSPTPVDIACKPGFYVCADLLLHPVVTPLRWTPVPAAAVGAPATGGLVCIGTAGSCVWTRAGSGALPEVHWGAAFADNNAFDAWAPGASLPMSPSSPGTSSTLQSQSTAAGLASESATAKAPAAATASGSQRAPPPPSQAAGKQTRRGRRGASSAAAGGAQPNFVLQETDKRKPSNIADKLCVIAPALLGVPTGAFSGKARIAGAGTSAGAVAGAGAGAGAGAAAAGAATGAGASAFVVDVATLPEVETTGQFAGHCALVALIRGSGLRETPATELDIVGLMRAVAVVSISTRLLSDPSLAMHIDTDRPMPEYLEMQRDMSKAHALVESYAGPVELHAIGEALGLHIVAFVMSGSHDTGGGFGVASDSTSPRPQLLAIATTRRNHVFPLGITMTAPLRQGGGFAVRAPQPQPLTRERVMAALQRCVDEFRSALAALPAGAAGSEDTEGLVGVVNRAAALIES